MRLVQRSPLAWLPAVVALLAVISVGDGRAPGLGRRARLRRGRALVLAEACSTWPRQGAHTTAGRLGPVVLGAGASARAGSVRPTG